MLHLHCFLSIFFVFLAKPSFGQGKGWVFHSQKDGIKLYTKPTDSDGTIHVRMIARTTASSQAVLKIYQDVSTVKERVLNTKSVTVLKKPSDTEVYYQLISDFTWPLYDRDAIMHQVITQDPVSKVIRMDTYSVPEYLPKDKDYVRISKWEMHNVSTPKPDGSIEIDYWTSYNPGGDVPIALVESFVEDGTITGMKRLIALTHKADN